MEIPDDPDAATPTLRQLAQGKCLSHLILRCWQRTQARMRGGLLGTLDPGVVAGAVGVAAVVAVVAVAEVAEVADVAELVALAWAEAVAGAGAGPGVVGTADDEEEVVEDGADGCIPAVEESIIACRPSAALQRSFALRWCRASSL